MHPGDMVGGVDDVPDVQCQRCKVWQDMDGFGVLHCGECGYCKHASRLDGVCQFCGDTANPEAKS